MDENSHYGESSKVPTYRLRQILNFLQVKEYLVVTSDEYAIVKLGKNAAALLNSDDEKVTMKLPKEQERVKTGKTSGAQGDRKGRKSPALHRILRQDAGTYVPYKTEK